MSLQCFEFDCEEKTTIVYHQWRDVINFPSCLVWISLREWCCPNTFLLQCTYKKMLTFLFHPRRREESCLPQQAYHLLLQHHLALLCIRRLHMSWTRNQSDPWRVSMLGKLCMFMTVQNLWSFCKELFIMSDRVSDIKNIILRAHKIVMMDTIFWTKSLTPERTVPSEDEAPNPKRG
jgi:hypothetical protein